MLSRHSLPGICAIISAALSYAATALESLYLPDSDDFMMAGWHLFRGLVAGEGREDDSAMDVLIPDVQHGRRSQRPPGE